MAEKKEVSSSNTGFSIGKSAIQQLYIANLNSMSAFAVAEQLGLALGIPAILDITFGVVAQKSTDHLLLQELALEMCSKSILYQKPF